MDLLPWLWEPAPPLFPQILPYYCPCPQEGLDGNNAEARSLKTEKGSEITYLLLFCPRNSENITTGSC